MNTEKEIVTEVATETLLQQPKTPFAKTPFLREIDVISQIYKWNPTGFRIVINLPLISDDRNPIFYLRAYPFIPHIPSDARHVGYQYAAMLMNYFRPVLLPFNPPLGELTTNSPQFVQYNAPPLLSILAQGNRRWRGDLEYRFRMASNFGNQGIIGCTPLFGVKLPIQISDFMNQALPFQPYDSGYLSTFANSFTIQDASMFRHGEVRIPWQKPYEWEDHFGNVNAAFHQLLNSNNPAWSETQQALGADATPSVADFVAFYLRGGLPTSASTNSINIEVDVRACENFEFAGEFIYPAPSGQRQIDATAGNISLNNTTYSLPRDIVIPDDKYQCVNLGPLRPK